mgnify:CR=1 FL=1
MRELKRQGEAVGADLVIVDSLDKVIVWLCAVPGLWFRSFSRSQL